MNKVYTCKHCGREIEGQAQHRGHQGNCPSNPNRAPRGRPKGAKDKGPRRPGCGRKVWPKTPEMTAKSMETRLASGGLQRSIDAMNTEHAQAKAAQTRAEQGGRFHSKLEQRVRDLYKESGYTIVWPFVVGRLTTDGYIKELHAVLEVDGCYWHGCQQCGYPARFTKDKARDAYYTASGFNVLRIPEHDVPAALPYLSEDD